MTNESFELGLQKYGTDLSQWPASLRQDAVTFAETRDGRRMVTAERNLQAALDLLPEVSVDSTFMDRLIDIPRTVPQSTGRLSQASQLFKDIFGLPAFGTPRALVAQATLAIFLFAGGITAGQTGTLSVAPQTSEDIDLIAVWAGGDPGLFTEEES